MSSTTGVIVAVYGIWSTNAPSTAEPNSKPVAARKKLSPNSVTAASPSHPTTPVCTRPATMTNKPMKNTRVGHSTSGNTFRDVDVGDQQHRARAEQRDDRRRYVQHRMQPEPGDDKGQHRHRPHEQAGVPDGSTFL